MSDAVGKPRFETPLAHLALGARARKDDQSAGVWANEAAARAFIVVRGVATDAAFVAGASKALGAPLPTTPCARVTADGLDVMWVSPDEWLVVAPRDRLSALLTALRTALAGSRHQVVDNSGGYTLIHLRGANARDVLAHCTVFDLDKLIPGRAVGTTFGKVSLYMYSDGAGYGLIVRRSYAEYVWTFLERAALPYGFGVAELGSQS